MADYRHERALQKNRVRRRGIYLLPNLFTTAALFAGFYAIVQAMNLRLRPGGGRDLRRDGARRPRRARRAPDANAERVRRRVRQPRRHGVLRRGAGARSSTSGRCATWASSAGSPRSSTVAGAALRLARFNTHARRRRQALVHRACRARRRRRSSRASCGSSTTTASIPAASMVGVVRDGVRGPHDGQQRQVLELQDDQPEEERAVRRDLPVRAGRRAALATSRRSCCSRRSSSTRCRATSCRRGCCCAIAARAAADAR